MSDILSTLAAPEVIETLSFEAMLAEAKADYQARYPEFAEVIDLESEPAAKLMEVFVYRELNLRARYNDEARALLLAYAMGADLDHIAYTYFNGATRLVITPADPSTIPPTPEVLESDAEFRQRLILQPEGESVAGPRDAYRYHAISASGQVLDARAVGGEDGAVNVYILARNTTGIPDAALLATVESALNDETVRPMNDDVSVHPANIIDYELDVSIEFFSGPDGEPVRASAETALAAFGIASFRLDTDIHRSKIDAVAHSAGIKRAIINSPAADILGGPSQAPRCISVNVAIIGEG